MPTPPQANHYSVLIFKPKTVAGELPKERFGKSHVRRENKEGRYLIALAHEGKMKGGLPPLIGSPWASAERSPPLLG
jgi:hypothetical protein